MTATALRRDGLSTQLEPASTSHHPGARRSPPPQARHATPDSPHTKQPRLRLTSLLRDYHDAYRRVASARCNKCGWLVIEPSKGAEIRRRRNRCHLDNVMRCGLIWECPTCGAHIKAERAQEAEAVKAWHVDQYGEDAAVMITLTIRHGLGPSLSWLRTALAEAWRLFQQGHDWQEAKADLALVGTIRALEVTWGPVHGWHPHLHIAAFFRRPPSLDFERLVFERWRRCVVATLGEDFAPLEGVGVVITPCRNANYLAKLGLEISAPNSKAAHEGHQTPLDMLAAFAETGDCSELERYQGYVGAMRGAKQLTWSRGLKAAAGIVDKTDEQIVEGSDEADELITTVTTSDFHLLRRMPGVIATMLELAELYGKGATDQFVRLMMGEVTAATRAILRRRGLYDGPMGNPEVPIADAKRAALMKLAAEGRERLRARARVS